MKPTNRCNCPQEIIDSADFEKAPLDCPLVYEEIAKGMVKCGFQIESGLLQTYCKKLRPEIIGHISALIAAVRPGTLKVLSNDGQNMAIHYCLRKNKEEELSYLHPKLIPILEPTYSVLIYQEQVLEIASKLAGFTLSDSVLFIKAISKKKADQVAKYKGQLIEGLIKLSGFTEEEAKKLWDNIEKSNRYLFNASHSIAYAHITYYTMWCKTHLLKPTELGWLRHAENKAKSQNEIAAIVDDCKLYDIKVKNPDLRDLKNNFYLKKGDILFGLTNIKGIGESLIKKIKGKIKELEETLNKTISDLTFWEFLVYLSPQINSQAIIALISTGALDYMKDSLGNSRTWKLTQFNKYSQLTEKEQEYIEQNIGKFSSLIDALKIAANPKREGGAASNYKRSEIITDILKTLENPPTSQTDNLSWLHNEEERLLGIPLSISKVEIYDGASRANCSCKDYLAGCFTKPTIAAEIVEIKEVETKRGKCKGQKMAFLKVKDSSCTLDNITVFAETYQEYGGHLVKGNVVLISGYRDKNKGGLIVQKIWTI